jgi:hypothetical protein
MRFAFALVALGLAGCAAPAPLVDMTGVDPVRFQRDLDRCEAIARGPETFGPLVAGAIMGASFGMGVGAFAGTSSSVSVAEGIGGGAGAAAGTGTAAIIAPAPAPVPSAAPEETRSVADCLRAHGYKPLPPAPA